MSANEPEDFRRRGGFECEQNDPYYEELTLICRADCTLGGYSAGICQKVQDDRPDICVCIP